MNSGSASSPGAAARRAAAPPSAFRAFRYLHLVGVAAVVLALGFLALRYDRVDVPAGHWQLSPIAAPGDTLMCVDLESSTPLGRDALVEFESASGRRFSRIAAVPGDVVTWRAEKSGGATCLVEGRPVDWRIDAGAPRPIAEGPLPADVFLLLDPNIGAARDDSRTAGGIPRAKIVRKVVFAGWGA